MTIQFSQNNNLDYLFNFSLGEVSKSFWNTYLSTQGDSLTRIAAGLKYSMNIYVDGLGLAYKRPGTISTAIISSGKYDKIIGVSENLFFTLSNVHSTTATITLHNGKTHKQITQTITSKSDVLTYGNSISIFHSRDTALFLKLNDIFHISISADGAAFTVENVTKFVFTSSNSYVDADVIVHGNEIHGHLPAGNYAISRNNTIRIWVYQGRYPGTIAGPCERINNAVLTQDLTITGKIYDVSTNKFYSNGTIIIKGGVLNVESLLVNGAAVWIAQFIPQGSTMLDNVHAGVIEILVQSENRFDITQADSVTISGASVAGSTDAAASAEFYNGRLIIGRNGKIYFSDVGNYGSFGTNQLNVSGVGVINSMITVNNAVILSDGNSIYKLIYLRGTGITEPWAIIKLANARVIEHGLLLINNKIIVVCKHNVFEIQPGGTFSNMAGEESIIMNDISAHLRHFFNKPVVRALQTAEQGVFVIITSDGEVVRLVLAKSPLNYVGSIQAYLSGTRLKYEGASPQTVNYGLFNSVISPSGEYESLDWIPPFYPDNNNVVSPVNYYSFILNHWCFLDSAYYLSGCVHVKYTNVNGNVISGRIDIEPHNSDYISHIYRNSDFSVGTVIYMMDGEDDLYRLKITSLDRDSIHLDLPTGVKLVAPVNVLGKEIFPTVISSGVLDRYKNKSNVYIAVNTGKHINVTKYDSERAKYLQGCAFSIGFGYDSYMSLLTGGYDISTKKISGHIGLIDTQELEFIVTSNREERIEHVTNLSLVPDSYKFTLPSLRDYTGSYPDITLKFGVGLYGCTNRIVFNIIL